MKPLQLFTTTVFYVCDIFGGSKKRMDEARFEEEFVFYRSEERGKCFIGYILKRIKILIL